VLRAAYRTFVNVPVPPRPALIDPTVLTAPPALAAAGGRSGDVTALGGYRAVGSTRGTSFVDRSARAGRRYDYEVVALDPSGRVSTASNLVQVPDRRPAVSRRDVANAVARVPGAHGDRSLALAARGPAAADLRDLVHRLRAQTIHAGACRR